MAVLAVSSCSSTLLCCNYANKNYITSCSWVIQAFHNKLLKFYTLHLLLLGIKILLRFSSHSKQITLLALKQSLQEKNLTKILHRQFYSFQSRCCNPCIIISLILECMWLDVIHHDKLYTVKVKCVFNQARLSAIQLPWYFKDHGSIHVLFYRK